MLQSDKSGKRRLKDNLTKAAVYTAAAITAMLTVSLIGYIFVKGIGHISWDFLTSSPSALRGTIGILPNIINTLYIVFASLLITLPIGVGAAIYMNEYAKNKKFIAAIEFTTETLAGIPSIIYGLFGMLFFCQVLSLQTSLIAGALTISLMNMPTIIRTAQEALKTVPESYREGAMGLGATKWVVIKTIVLPASADGIINGCILSVGRAVGESAALLFTAGVGSVIADNVFEAMTRTGASLSVALYVYVFERGEFEIGFAIAAILMIIVIVINMGARATKKRFTKI